MKEKILKFMPLVVLLMAFIDTNYSLMQSVGIPAKFIDWIKLLGLLLVAYTPSITAMFNKKQEHAQTETEEDYDIGGGGIKNPPKP